MAGIDNPESVGKHSCRTALLRYILASIEGADPQKAMICLLHEMGETRINDLHRVAKRYIDVGNRKEVAFEEQAERLPQPLAENVVAFMYEYERRTSFEGQLAHDADLLECLIQAREYQAQGPTVVQDWITNCYAGFQSDAAKSIADACLSVEPSERRQGLKNMGGEQK